MVSPIYVTGKASPENRIEKDAYNTPPEVVRKTIDKFTDTHTLPEFKKILDLGCGDGIWGKYIRTYFPTSEIIGVEVKPIEDFPKNYYDCYDIIYNCDIDHFLSLSNSEKFGLIIGNPPYKGLRKRFSKVLSLLKDDASYLAWLLPLSYLQGSERYKTILKNRLSSVFVYVNRIKWYGNSPHGQHAFYIIGNNTYVQTIEFIEN